MAEFVSLEDYVRGQATRASVASDLHVLVPASGAAIQRAVPALADEARPTGWMIGSTAPVTIGAVATITDWATGALTDAAQAAGVTSDLVAGTFTFPIGWGKDTIWTLHYVVDMLAVPLPAEMRLYLRDLTSPNDRVTDARWVGDGQVFGCLGASIQLTAALVAGKTLAMGAQLTGAGGAIDGWDSTLRWST